MAIKAPGGICIKCLEDPRNVIIRRDKNTISAYCGHNKTGGIGILTGSGIAWHLLTPISRENWFEDTEGTETQNQGVSAPGGTLQ